MSEVKSFKPLYLTKVIVYGGRTLVYVPRDIVKALGIEAGDIAEITVDTKSRSLTVKFLKPVRLE